MRQGSAALYLLAILAVLGMSLAFLAVLKIYRVEIDQGLVGQAMSIVLPTLAALLALLRSIQNGEGIQKAAVIASEAKTEAASARVELRENTAATLTANDKLDRLTGESP